MTSSPIPGNNTHTHVVFSCSMGTLHIPNGFYTVQTHIVSPYTNPSHKTFSILKKHHLVCEFSSYDRDLNCLHKDKDFCEDILSP